MSRFWNTASAVPLEPGLAPAVAAPAAVDELVEAAFEEPPAALHVPDQALRLVLRADADAADARN